MFARLATGLVLAPLLVWLLLAGPLPLIVGVVALAAALATHELLSMFDETRGALAALAALLAAAIAGWPLLPAGVGIGLVGAGASLLLIVCLRNPDDLVRQSRAGALAVLGLGYVGAMAAALSSIAALPETDTPGAFAFGPAALLGHFVLVFLGDTGAYFAGRFFGRRKLYPLVSPKKTVEGSIGGTLATVIGFVAYAHYLLPALSPVEAAVGAGLVGVVAQIGDLAESMFKRATGTKDSGKLLPGHGGMLDRIDGALFGAPWTLLWLTLLHGA